jgi:putative transcriptional regulator
LTASHHPDRALLLDYATGALEDPFALIVATHMALCPACRMEVSAMEAIGGALLDVAEPRDDGLDKDDSFASLMARIESLPAEPAPLPRPPLDPAMAMIPRPLRDRLSSGPGQLPWRPQGPVETVFLPCDLPRHKVRMLRIAPGRGVPRHTHRGVELTLVLQGGFSDETGHYGRGDLESADGTLDHRPVADPGGPCLCLAVTSAPLRLTGRLGRLIDPFLDI